MNLIGFTHTKEDIVNTQNICQEKIKQYVKEDVKYTFFMLFGIVFFIVNIVVLLGKITGKISPFINHALHMGTQNENPSIRFGTILLFFLSLFIAAWIVYSFFMLFCLLLEHYIIPKKIRFGHQKYQYYENASTRLSKIAEIYQLYEDLMQSDEKASINEEGTVVSVIHNKDTKYGLPEQVTYHLSEDMREHLFSDNGISFAYYDNQIDELIKEM